MDVIVPRKFKQIMNDMGSELKLYKGRVAEADQKVAEADQKVAEADQKVAEAKKHGELFEKLYHELLEALDYVHDADGVVALVTRAFDMYGTYHAVDEWDIEHEQSILRDVFCLYGYDYTKGDLCLRKR